MSAYDHRRWLRLDVGFIILFAGLLAYNVLAWRRLSGRGAEWRPLPSIALSACLFFLSLASIARRRSRPLFGALLAMGIAALAVSLAAR